MIRINGLTFKYDKHTEIFHNQNVFFPKNSLTIILGCNGTGKSTLLKCINREIDSFAGSIFISGKDSKKLNQRELSKLVSFVPQSFGFSIDYEVLDFITFGRTPFLSLFKNPSLNDYEIAKKISEKQNIGHLLNKKINELSGGEKQLVYITRALVQDTPIILMDEPMSALDFENQAKLLGVIKQLLEDGKTIVITSHNPNHALALQSEVCLIDKNHKILQGSYSLLCDNQLLNSWFGPNVLYKNGTISFLI